MADLIYDRNENNSVRDRRVVLSLDYTFILKTWQLFSISKNKNFIKYLWKLYNYIIKIGCDPGSL